MSYTHKRYIRYIHHVSYIRYIHHRRTDTQTQINAYTQTYTQRQIHTLHTYTDRYTHICIQLYIHAYM